MMTLRLALALYVTAILAGPACASEPALRIHANFTVELVYTVSRAVEGSWISLASDSRGDLYAADQRGPLYRLTASRECMRLDLPLGGVHGLAWHGSELYAVAGERDICPTGLYRARDSNADQLLDAVELLLPLEGSGEHGPHAVELAPGGRSLFVLAGNGTALPAFAKSRLARLPAADTLLPALPAHMGSESRGHSHGGWICRTDLSGQNVELVCCGLRNAYALAVNPAGDLFTADSDTEFEYGLPWYRPNRLLHCVSGADFGWRSGANKPRGEAPDVAAALASLGAGSPSSIVLAASAHQYPERYRDCLLVGDWSQGRLLAVHLSAQGASYTATVEQLVIGSPLPIASGCISPRDGMFYFVTGGRNTQSHVYRLKWRG